MVRTLWWHYLLERWIHLKVSPPWDLSKDRVTEIPKRPCECWEGLGAGGEGTTEDEMAGWLHRLNGCEFWVNSGSWWWTGRPGVLWSMGSQRVGHNWVTELLNMEESHIPDAKTWDMKSHVLIKWISFLLFCSPNYTSSTEPGLHSYLSITFALSQFSHRPRLFTCWSKYKRE